MYPLKYYRIPEADHILFIVYHELYSLEFYSEVKKDFEFDNRYSILLKIKKLI